MALNVFNSYAYAYIASDQTARIAVGNHIEIDTLGFIGTAVDGTDVELTTGVDQANGNFKLKNNRYLVRVDTWGGTNEGTIQIQPALPASATALSDEAGDLLGILYHDDSNSSDVTQPSCMYFIVDATGGDVEFRMRFVAINTAIVNMGAKITAYPLGAVDGGATFDSYAKVIMSVNQTANLAVGNHVEFDAISYVGTVVSAANVLLATGAGQADGLFTLKDLRYLMITELLGQTNEGRFGCRWTDSGGTQTPDDAAVTQVPRTLHQADDNQGDVTNGPSSSLMILDSTGGDIDTECRIYDNANLVAIYGTLCKVLIIPIMES